jgi:hypothetical protein
MWQPLLILALAVAAWRWLMRRRRDEPSTGPFPDVGDAPEDAEPILTPRLDDTGLATYSMVLPKSRTKRAGGTPRAAPRRVDPDRMRRLRGPRTRHSDSA